MSTVLSTTERGVKKAWGGFFAPEAGAKEQESKSPGIIDTIITAWNSIGGNDAWKRFDKTDEVCIKIKGETLYFEDKDFKIPTFLNFNKKARTSEGILKLSVKGYVYHLKPIEQGNAHIKNVNGDKLYEIVDLKEGLGREPDKYRQTKAYAVWIDGDNNISSANAPGAKVTYNFEGKIKSFLNVDRDPRTKQINLLTTAVTMPLGIAAIFIKWLGYRPANFAFSTVPKLLDRVIVPAVSFAVFLPIFVIGKPISLLTERSREQFSSFFGNLLDFNKNVLANGFSDYLKKNVCDQKTIDDQIKALKDGVIEGEAGKIYAKKGFLTILNGLSHLIQLPNIVIPNLLNIASSWVKGVGNVFLAAAHQDGKFLQTAKFLFTEPLKIARDEFKQEFKSPNEFKSENKANETPLAMTMGTSKTEGTGKDEAREVGNELYRSGVRSGESRISYNTAISPTYSGTKPNPKFSPAVGV